MYEATVSVVKENAHLLDFIKGQMEPAMSEVDGIISELQGQRREYVSLACADTYRFQIRRILLDAVLQALTLGYKNVVFRDLLKIRKSNFYQNVLVNTICIFDNDYDKQMVSRVVDVDKELCLDGYYNFRLGHVKKKWTEVIKLVSDNFYVLSDSQMIVEFLQYLLESTPSKVKNLSVSVDDDFVLYGSADKVIEPTFSLARETSCEEELMLNILWLKPQNVKIYTSRKLNEDFCNMLNSLFEVDYIDVQ